MTKMTNRNANLTPQNRKYIMRIAGGEPTAKAELDNFIAPESRYPVIMITSNMPSTAVDAQPCTLIVLDQMLQSRPQFKRIIAPSTHGND